MSEDKDKNDILLSKYTDKVLQNLLESSGKCIGDTFSDIWYIVLGGSLSYIADKKKIKYAINLQKYKREIEEELNKIDNENLIEADIQIMGQALEASKFCVEKEVLRKMFAKLIASSVDVNKANYVRPIFCDIVKHLTPLDAKILRKKSGIGDFDTVDWNEKDEFILSLSSLLSLGLIEPKHELEADVASIMKNCGKKLQSLMHLASIIEYQELKDKEKILKNMQEIRLLFENNTVFETYVLGMFNLSQLAKNLCEVCF